ncbi:hypothetical protein EVAR_32334_1 [Eumeta japonica]|uniref:Uncharacterized protein n=1 Tax=Eumeta variegata TaxID=151549 RepID=A0A4C1ZA35_EUMVA|nr:hypothetical protein EVAR_32334_1 [Eumeta japonica]
MRRGGAHSLGDEKMRALVRAGRRRRWRRFSDCHFEIRRLRQQPALLIITPTNYKFYTRRTRQWPSGGRGESGASIPTSVKSAVSSANNASWTPDNDGRGTSFVYAELAEERVEP